MSPRMHSFFFYIATAVLVIMTIIFLRNNILPIQSLSETLSAVNKIEQVAAVAANPTSTTQKISSPVSTSAPQIKTAKKAIFLDKKTPSAKTQTTSSSTLDQAAKTQDPYPFPPLSFSTINDNARNALINILCAPRDGSLRPISASGVIIDPRGIILTNAHVGQYVLLSQSPEIDLSCVARTGSPASAKFNLETLYIPPVWVYEHVSEIDSQHALGTGEHDYALLRITSAFDGSPIQTTLPYLPVDTREAIAFTGDEVLAASYPAEFLSGTAAQSNLYAVSSVTTVKQLLTFAANTVDLISLGGILEAQSGSSGGPVVNAWNHLVGIIVTTSEAATTGQRDLRALTLRYIDRDMADQSGSSLQTILAGDPQAEAARFNANTAPLLIKKYIEVLAPNHN